MSKAGQEANDQRAKEGADAQGADLELPAETRARLRLVAGGPANEQGSAPEGTETAKLPSFDEAMTEVETVGQGDNKALDELAKKYGSGPMSGRYIIRRSDAPNGGSFGWHCEGHDKGPLTLEQSEALAKAINVRVDEDKMRERSESKRAKKIGKAEAPEVTEAPELILARETLAVIPSIWDTIQLAQLQKQCEVAGLIELTQDGKYKKSVAIPGVALSKRLAKAFELQFQQIREERVREARIEGIIRKIGATESLSGLLEGARWLANDLGILKIRITGGKWEVVAINDVPGSHRIVEVLMERKARLEEVEAAAKTARGREGLERILKQFKPQPAKKK